MFDELQARQLRFVPGALRAAFARHYPNREPKKAGACANRENPMSDQHQVNLIIAAAISDARKDHPDGRIDPEEAKQVAKCIIEALSSAGLQIVPMRKV
jgi:hypothetical protein